MSVTILVVDDHPIVRQGLRRLLEVESEFKVSPRAVGGDRARGRDNRAYSLGAGSEIVRGIEPGGVLDDEVAGRIHANAPVIADNIVVLDAAAVDRTRIEAALERIADGTYGHCIDCSQPIAEERLEARPEVTRCVKDQQRFEARRG